MSVRNADLPFHDDEPHNQGAHDQIPEAQRILHGLLAEMPDEARRLMDRIERGLKKVASRATTRSPAFANSRPNRSRRSKIASNRGVR